MSNPRELEIREEIMSMDYVGIAERILKLEAMAGAAMGVRSEFWVPSDCWDNFDKCAADAGYSRERSE